MQHFLVKVNDSVRHGLVIGQIRQLCDFVVEVVSAINRCVATGMSIVDSKKGGVGMMVLVQNHLDVMRILHVVSPSTGLSRNSKESVFGFYLLGMHALVV